MNPKAAYLTLLAELNFLKLSNAACSFSFDFFIFTPWISWNHLWFKASVALILYLGFFKSIFLIRSFAESEI
jgi:hypothetical protein